MGAGLSGLWSGVMLDGSAPVCCSVLDGSAAAAAGVMLDGSAAGVMVDDEVTDGSAAGVMMDGSAAGVMMDGSAAEVMVDGSAAGVMVVDDDDDEMGCGSWSMLL